MADFPQLSLYEQSTKLPYLYILFEKKSEKYQTQFFVQHKRRGIWLQLLLIHLQ